MHIGLIGGIGPVATTIYYTRLVEAFRKAKLPLQLTITHASIDVLAEHARAGDRDAQSVIFTDHLLSLEGAGCDVALITALTGHFCFHQTRALSPLDLMDGVGVIDSYCKKENIKVLGLLGSPPVMSSHLFGMLKSVKTVVPKFELQLLGDAYMAIAGSGACNQDQRQRFFGASKELVEELSADAVLLAGTDLGLVFSQHTLPYRILDAVDLHVNELVERAAQFPRK